jgi:hypothetical protein
MVADSQQRAPPSSVCAYVRAFFQCVLFAVSLGASSSVLFGVKNLEFRVPGFGSE